MDTNITYFEGRGFVICRYKESDFKEWNGTKGLNYFFSRNWEEKDLKMSQFDSTKSGKWKRQYFTLCCVYCILCVSHRRGISSQEKREEDKIEIKHYQKYISFLIQEEEIGHRIDFLHNKKVSETWDKGLESNWKVKGIGWRMIGHREEESSLGIKVSFEQVHTEDKR